MDYFLDAHYRTSTRDLLRLMDAPGMHFSATLSCDPSGDSVVAALWLVNEGGLKDELARDIWAGRRRPPGSLGSSITRSA